MVDRTTTSGQRLAPAPGRVDLSAPPPAIRNRRNGSAGRSPRRRTMSGRHLRRAAAAATLGVGAILGALAILYGEDAPAWGIPLLAAAILLLCDLVSLSRGPAPEAVVERPAVIAVLVGRLLVAALLAFAGATVALLAAAIPVRYGLATGLLGAAAAAALFLLVTALAQPGSEA